MDKKEKTKLNFEVKALLDNSDDKYYHIEGIASTPDIDNAGDIVTPQAMLESFKNFGLPKFPHQHDLEQMPLGVWDSYELRGEATILKGRIPKVDNEKLFALIEMGAYGGLSIGFIVISAEDEDGNDITRKRNHKGLRVITSMYVFETSLVTVPCNEFAEVLEVKSANFDADKLKEIKSFYEKENKGNEMKIETKGAMLANFINESINDKESEGFTRSDWVSYIARMMSLSEESVEAMITGERDLIGENEAYNLAWALDTYSEVIRQIAIAEKLDELGLSNEDGAETKNRFENCETLRDIEKELKTLNITSEESKTIISKVKSVKRDAENDLEEKTEGSRDDETQSKTESKALDEALESLNSIINKK